MYRHFVQELDALKRSIIRMGSLAEQAIVESIRALLESRKEVARQVIARDKEIDACEVKIDEQIVDLLALQQPVATDLRFILAASGITNDLERIGDHAVNIAESALQYADRPAAKSLADIAHMARLTKQMLRDVIDGFIHNNPSLCRMVLSSDDVVDGLNKRVVSDLAAVMRKSPDAIEQALELIRVSRNLERIADLATNIAEEVIFVADAEVVRHHVSEHNLSENEL